MSQLFQRKPIAELLVDEADASKSLKRVLGAGELIMLAIGAVIGAGIFVGAPRAGGGNRVLEVWQLQRDGRSQYGFVDRRDLEHRKQFSVVSVAIRTPTALALR